MTALAELAEDCGIALPAMLRQLIDAGHTSYGDIAAWRADWKGNTLAARRTSAIWSKRGSRRLRPWPASGRTSES